MFKLICKVIKLKKVHIDSYKTLRTSFANSFLRYNSTQLKFIIYILHAVAIQHRYASGYMRRSSSYTTSSN